MFALSNFIRAHAQWINVSDMMLAWFKHSCAPRHAREMQHVSWRSRIESQTFYVSCMKYVLTNSNLNAWGPLLDCHLRLPSPKSAKVVTPAMFICSNAGNTSQCAGNWKDPYSAGIHLNIDGLPSIWNCPEMCFIIYGPWSAISYVCFAMYIWWAFNDLGTMLGHMYFEYLLCVPWLMSCGLLE